MHATNAARGPAAAADQKRNSRAGGLLMARAHGGANQGALEQSANQAAQWVFAGKTFPTLAASGGSNASGLAVQRKCACEGSCDSCQSNEENLLIQRMPSNGPATEPQPGSSPPDGTAEEASQQAAPLGLVVEDGTPVGPGQMTRSAFMATIRARLFAICDEELAAVGRSAQGCPYLNQWLDHYDRRTASQLDRAIRSYAPGARDATEVVEAVVSRVRVAVRIWTTTGMVTGIPGAGSLLGGAMSMGAQIGDAVTNLFGGSSSPSSGNGAVQAKLDGSHTSSPSVSSANPAAIRSQLSGGRSLESGIRSRMERGFGRSFGGVRIHTDQTATRLAQGLSARAFTVGHDIAFSAGEYRPGTVGGDLLIAHELAHTVQQGAAEGDYVQPMGGDGSLEDDADMAAIGAVGSELGLTDRMEPERQSGLRLQGCQEVKKRCPSGYSWRVHTAIGFGSFGCDCVWKCRPGGPPAPPSSGPTVRCPSNMNCSSGVRYEDVSDDYTHHGHGAALTPLGGGACGCFPLTIDGEQISESPLLPSSFEMTGLAAPTADMMAAGAARVRARAGGGTGGGVTPITDPRTGTVIPPSGGSPAPPNRPIISPPAVGVGTPGRGAPASPASPPANVPPSQPIRPINGTVNVGGGLEPGSATASNLNPIVPGTGGPTRGIPNHVRAGFEQIGQVFEAGSVTSIISNRLTFNTVNWSQAAEGSFRVMAPGGRISLNVWTQSQTEVNTIINAFTQAGFRNVRNMTGQSGSATVITGDR